jgi:16S rRNA (guanine966-N2)-methyltransferase
VARGPRNQLRIIGGEWRGRKLAFADVPGLRPTGDRIRETLFNWLAPYLPGARCLDLFAGSGALGLEAASRGASRVVMLDRAPAVVRLLREHCATLHAGSVEVLQADALQYLGGTAEPCDIVFLDPPFHQGLLQPCCERLETHGWLAPRAWIYLEAERELGEPALPEGWVLHRSKAAGEVGYYLATRSDATQTARSGI